jgi:chemotaxis protein CheX
MVDVAFINPFIQATKNVFDTMVFLKIEIGKPILKEQSNHRADISGSIGLAGATHGVTVVAFTEEVACKVSAKMLGEEPHEMDETVHDSIGEIANMIAGGAKGILQEKGLDFKIALPSVTVGKDHQLSYPEGVPCVVVPFTIPDLNTGFHIEVCLVTSP